MYARVAIATGWTWEYIGQNLTLPRLTAMYAYWNEYPPVHESLAITGGFTRGVTSPSTTPTRTAATLDNATIVRDMHTDPRTLQWRNSANG